MPRSADEARGYSRGYFAAASRRWHEHRPPLPPDPVLRRIIEAAQKLRDGVDGELAKFDAADPLVDVLGPLIDDFDEAMRGLSGWLKEADHADGI